METAYVYPPPNVCPYSHHAGWAFFKGRSFASWSNSRKDEHAPGAPTLCVSHSGDTAPVYWQDVVGWDFVQSANGATPFGSPTLTGETNYLNLVNPSSNIFFRLKNP